MEIELKKRLQLPKGEKLDAKITGRDVDIKFSISENWMIPTEAADKLCMLASANDRDSRYSLGMIRISEDALRPGANKDRKRSISAEGKKRIRWVVRNGQLQQNFLLHMDEETRSEVLDKNKSGQQRINSLLRRVKGKKIPRYVICVLGQQEDPMKRLRDAKKALAKEGIVVVCGKYLDDRAIAHAKGFDIGPTETVSFDGERTNEKILAVRPTVKTIPDK